MKIRALFLIGFLIINCAVAQNPGTLDTLWADSGSVVIESTDARIYCERAGKQSDGKLILGGWANIIGMEEDELFAMRVTANGEHDYFGNQEGGFVYDLGTNEFITSLYVDDSNNIFLIGCSDLRGFVIKLLPEGVIDVGYGEDGLILSDEFGMFDCAPVQIDNNQSLVICGYDYTESKLLLINEDGSVNENFGDNGWAILQSEYTLVAENVSYNEDHQSIYVSGNALEPDIGFVAKFSLDGEPDVNFGNNGYILLKPPTPGNKLFIGAQLLHDVEERITIAGEYEHIDGDYDFFACQYDGNGNIIESFGDEGWHYLRMEETNESLMDIAEQKDGKIYLSGSISHPSGKNAIVERLMPDGITDVEFGLNGVIENDMGKNEKAMDLVFDSLQEHLFLTQYTYDFDSEYAAVVVSAFYTGFTSSHISNNDYDENEPVLYPNPARDHFVIYLNKFSKDILMEVYSNAGKKLFSKKYHSVANSIKVNIELDPGAYLINLQGSNFNCTKKLIISSYE